MESLIRRPAAVVAGLLAVLSTIPELNPIITTTTTESGSSIALSRPQVLVSAEYDGDSFRGSIAKEISQAACYRLFANEGDIGCRSPSSDGSTGALFEVRSESDFAEAAAMDQDLVIVMPAQYFTAENLATLQTSSRTKGILILEDTSSDAVADNAFLSSGKYSTEVTTPQGDGTLQSTFTLNPSAAWNANHGNGIAYESLTIPIVRVDRYESATVREYCSDNRKYGYHSNRVGYANMRFYMGKTGITSKQCLEWTDIYDDRSPQCIPLGGQSVWGTTGAIDARPKVVGTVGIDSTSQFHDIAWGANDAAASVAAFLGAVEAIGNLNHAAFASQIVFFAANAEEWGYVGSRQFVKDIKGFYCGNWVNDTQITDTGMPLCADPVYPNAMFTELLTSYSKDQPLTAIRSVVALDQIGVQANADVNPSFYVYSTASGTSATVASVQAAAGSVANTNVAVSASVDIPPTPGMTFEREFDALKGETVVISAYDGAYIDPAHHTQYDAPENVNINSVIRASELFAKSLVTIAGGDATLVSINETWVRSALTCLTEDWNCEFMAGYVDYEEKNLEEMLGYGVYLSDGVSYYSPDSSVTSNRPSYYTGVLASYGLRQPAVQHQNYLYGRYTGAWTSEDMAFVVPTKLEAFIRSAISYHVGQKDMNKFLFKWIEDDHVQNSGAASVQASVGLANIPAESMPCSTSSDCASAKCDAVSYKYYDIKLECIQGHCICPTAFYHIALDPGIERQETYGLFNVIDTDTPSFTEPNWASDVGVYLYTKADPMLGVIALVVGSGVFALSAFFTFGKFGFSSFLGF